MSWKKEMANLWVKDFYFDSVSRAVHDAVVELLEFIPEGNDYAAEKLIKSFSENIRSLQALLFYQEDCSPHTALKKAQNHDDMERIRSALTKVEQRLLNEVSRLKRHYVIFLGVVRQAGRRTGA